LIKQDRIDKRLVLKAEERTAACTRRRADRLITDELRARADAEVLAEGTRPRVAEPYELARSMDVFADGLLRYFKRPLA